jgi:hypothetical protein
MRAAHFGGQCKYLSFYSICRQSQVNSASEENGILYQVTVCCGKCSNPHSRNGGTGKGSLVGSGQMGLFSEDLGRCRMDNIVRACHGPIWHVVCSDDSYALAGGQLKALATSV